MIITLIGMSNLGKTHWSNRLVQECGFERVDCDALVEAKLAPYLKSQGYAGIQDVAKWMGFPFDTQYPETSKKFVECEREVMLEILAKYKFASDRPVVFDSCGSVIYTGDDVMKELREMSQVVYLEASSEHREQLFTKYIEEPKPVVWGDNAFSSLPNEDPMTTLKRCYPNLLELRAKRYNAVAEITVPFDQHRAVGASLIDIFPQINRSLV